MIKENEIKKSYDVIVAGGGLAGVMAAIAASRNGMSVLLLEKNGYLGGMATGALVNPFMSYHERGKGGQLANGGLFLELLNNLNKAGGTNTLYSRAFCDETMKLVLDRMILQNNISFLYHAFVSDAAVKNKKITSIEVCTHYGKRQLDAKIFIDATGNADVSYFAGVRIKQGRESDGLCQPMTTCFRLCNVDWGRFNKEKTIKIYQQFRREGKIINQREDLLIFKTVNSPENGIMHFNSTRVIAENPILPEQHTQAEISGREQVFELYKMLKENCEGFENSTLVKVAPEIGIRESRRIIGYYELTDKDIIGTAKFEDSIARGTYEIDIHNPNGSGTTIVLLKDYEYYTIPFRSLVPIDIDNLLVAGRPISSTHEAHSAIRIMPITTCIGQAAGVAAAYAVKTSVNKIIDVDIKKVQSALISQGALV